MIKYNSKYIQTVIALCHKFFYCDEEYEYISSNELGVEEVEEMRE